MTKFLKTFKHDEDGAVTVDWVVLTAAIVGMAVAIYLGVEGGALDLSDGIASYLSNFFS